MITVTQKTINLQAEGRYGEIKVAGGTEVNGTQAGQIYGSVYKEDQYIGSFNSGDSVSVTVDNKDNLGLMPEIVTAATEFVADLNAEAAKLSVPVTRKN